MGFSVTRTGFTYNNNVLNTTDVPVEQCLFLNLVQDFIQNGFILYDSEVVDPKLTSSKPATPDVARLSKPITSLQLGTVCVILLPTKDIDPHIDDNPWFLKITADQGPIVPLPQPSTSTSTSTSGYGSMYMYLGLSIAVSKYDPTTEMPKIGSLIVNNTSPYSIIPTTSGNKGDSTPRMYLSTPYGYSLTIVNRGFALNVYNQQATDDMKQCGTFCVQRAMTCGGSVVDSGNMPLYLVTNITRIMPLCYYQTQPDSSSNTILGPQGEWYYQIIRENNNQSLYPSWTIYDSNYSSDSRNNGGNLVLVDTTIGDTREYTGNVLHRFPTSWNAPVTRDTGEYVLLFPFGLCSRKYAYTDELDLISVSKANAFQFSQEVPVSVYGQDRTYTALNTNNTQTGNANGIRVFLYTKGPEITAPTSYPGITIPPTDLLLS